MPIQNTRQRPNLGECDPPALALLEPASGVDGNIVLEVGGEGAEMGGDEKEAKLAARAGYRMLEAYVGRRRSQFVCGGSGLRLCGSVAVIHPDPSAVVGGVP
jgi:hypothetical protein